MFIGFRVESKGIRYVHNRGDVWNPLTDYIGYDCWQYNGKKQFYIITSGVKVSCVWGSDGTPVDYTVESGAALVEVRGELYSWGARRPDNSVIVKLGHDEWASRGVKYTGCRQFHQSTIDISNCRLYNNIPDTDTTYVIGATDTPAFESFPVSMINMAPAGIGSCSFESPCILNGVIYCNALTPDKFGMRRVLAQRDPRESQAHVIDTSAYNARLLTTCMDSLLAIHCDGQNCMFDLRNMATYEVENTDVTICGWYSFCDFKLNDTMAIILPCPHLRYLGHCPKGTMFRFTEASGVPC